VEAFIFVSNKFSGIS